MLELKESQTLDDRSRGKGDGRAWRKAEDWSL